MAAPPLLAISKFRNRIEYWSRQPIILPLFFSLMIGQVCKCTYIYDIKRCQVGGTQSLLAYMLSREIPFSLMWFQILHGHVCPNLVAKRRSGDKQAPIRDALQPSISSQYVASSRRYSLRIGYSSCNVKSRSCYIAADADCSFKARLSVSVQTPLLI